ncbi:putative sodium-coupled neutral amino acid transporter 10 [Plodia interpunctella]|uniref:putative sodium-coupled neutral amino acid transporter 10 n=1 Tax=Plodia interpunctella TaxID=58824 RepID=UPI0023687C34|nr:putative sodium-coupled neutral amino acid transporter 10 [Plodia interpunctella]
MGTAGQSITLANSIIGVGILAMPFCFQQCGVLLATLILLFMGLVSRLCCYFLLKSALLARRRNFEFLAFHVFGPAGKLAVEIGIIGFLMGTCIAYFVVVGDLGPQIIAKLFNINQSDILRTSIMVLVSLLCVLPLGLLRNVDSLSNVSAATIGFYFCLVMKVIAEAASQVWTGEWQVHMELWKPSGLLQCVPIFSMALFCQTQLFEIFESLPTLSLEKMNLVTKNAINICTGVYFTLGVFGYIAFCSQQISGNILMSLSPTMGSDVIKLGFVLSLAFSFPLIIFPCRASLYSLLYNKVHSSHLDHIINHSIPETSFRCITVAIIAVTLFISLLIPNIELVLGLVGSTIGIIICIIFPCACFVNVTFKNTNERVLAKGVLVLGLIIMVLGTYANLQAAESQKDKYDERFITPEKIDKMVEEFFQKNDKSGDDDSMMVKPIDKNDVKIDENVIKDSKALPPNPVPPESLETPIKEPKHELKELENPIVSVHPKNLKKNDDLNSINGENNKISNGAVSDIDKPVDKPIEEKQVNGDKKDMEKKQQALIETIKQHGEEQKELLKEQQEILDEILKTKKEMEQKSEAEKNNEAKKIAVESIKKIADMAIQRLVGVSESPTENKKKDNIEKSDEAVEEIAKKAVETIEAIQEINKKAEDNPEQIAIPVPTSAPGPSQSVPQPAQNVQHAVQNVQNIPSPILNLPVLQNKPPVQNIQQPVQNVQLNEKSQQSAQIEQSVKNLQQPAQDLQSIQNQQQSVQNAQSIINQYSQQFAQNVQQPQQPLASAQQPQNIQSQVRNPQQQEQNLPGNAQQPANNDQPRQKIEQSVKNDVPQSVQNVEELRKQEDNWQVEQNEPNQNNQQQVHNIIQTIQNGQPVQNVQQQSQPSNQNAQVAQNVQNPVDNVPNVPQNIPLSANVAQFVTNNRPNRHVQNGNAQVQSDLKEKGHIHSQDEPKSYRLGEDAQKLDGNVNNIQSEAQNNQNADLKADASKVNDKKIENGAKNPVSRQKREVVDCTEKSALKPEDREICERLINVPQYKSDKIDLPNVDLNDILPRRLPLEANMVHIGRSLKSYDENENR